MNKTDKGAVLGLLILFVLAAVVVGSYIYALDNSPTLREPTVGEDGTDGPY